MEAALEVYPKAAEIVWGVMKGKVDEYVKDDIANFTFQALLTHATTGGGDMISDILPLIRNKTILQTNRTGVLFRLVQMSSRLQVLQEVVYNAVFGNTNVGEMLKIELSEKDGGRVKIDVNAARAVYWFLEGGFGGWGEKVMDGVKGLGNAEIEALVRDGMGSKVRGRMREDQGGRSGVIERSDGNITSINTTNNFLLVAPFVVPPFLASSRSLLSTACSIPRLKAFVPRVLSFCLPAWRGPRL